MDVSEIVDEKSFLRWLEDLPQGTEAERDEARRWAVLLAHRAAMRVLPVVWAWSVVQANRKHSVLPVFRANLTSSLSLAMPLLPAPTLFAVERAAYPDEANSGGAFDAFSAGIAAAKALSSTIKPGPNLADAHFAVSAGETALKASYSFVSKALGPAYFWSAVRTDCSALLFDGDPHRLPLWPAENPLADQWSTIRTHPSTQTPEWRFWIDWYDRALTGQPQDWKLLEKVALIDPKDWDKGADHVNALIAEIRLKRLAETRSLGEDAIDKGPDGRWHRVAGSDIDRDILRDACDRVKDTVKRIRKAMERGTNVFNALSDDLDHLDSALRRYKDRPLRLHDEFLKVQRHIARDLKSGELPDDHLVDDLNTDLGTAALDMRNACPKTAKVVADRASARFAELNERERKAIVQIAEAAATRSDEELAAEFREDAVEAVAPEAAPQDKAPVRYRLSTRLAMIATRDGKNLVDALILMGDLGGGLATFGAVVIFILSMIL